MRNRLRRMGILARLPGGMGILARLQRLPAALSEGSRSELIPMFALIRTSVGRASPPITRGTGIPARRFLPLFIAVAAAAALAGCPREEGPQTRPPPAKPPLEPLPLPEEVKGGASIRVAMVPKRKGMEYFNAAEKGARQAAADLNVELLYEGPEQADDVNKQIEIVESFIVQEVDVIAVSANDPQTIAPVLKKARDKGIHVLTWDADADPQASGREFMVDQASSEMIGRTLVDVMAEEAGEDAKYGIITGSLTAANQTEWMKWMEEQRKAKYPSMEHLETKPSGESQEEAFKVANAFMTKYGDELDGIFGITSVAFPGAAEAIKQAGKAGKVHVTGLSTPNEMRGLVKDGVVQTVLLWDVEALGYLTIVSARAVADGTLQPGATSLDAGKLGEKAVEGDRVVLGPLMRFTRENIDQYNF